MNPLEIDCRNLECPAPVMKTKRATENKANSIIRVLVNNEAAIENVSRFLSTNNFQVSVDSRVDFSIVEGTRKSDKVGNTPQDQESTSSNSKRSASRQGKTIILISSDKMGKGDDSLGEKLMINFIKTLPEMGDTLWRIVFVNSGVKLTISNSPLLSELNELAKSGIDILVCSTCLTHFGLMNSKGIGTTTNMMDILTSMQLAQKVISV